MNMINLWLNYILPATSACFEEVEKFHILARVHLVHRVWWRNEILCSIVSVLLVGMEVHGNDSDSFRRFLNKFCETHNGPLTEDDGLPFRLVTYYLRETEAEGECLDWTLQYLTSKWVVFISVYTEMTRVEWSTSVAALQCSRGIAVLESLARPCSLWRFLWFPVCR